MPSPSPLIPFVSLDRKIVFVCSLVGSGGRCLIGVRVSSFSKLPLLSYLCCDKTDASTLVSFLGTASFISLAVHTHFLFFAVLLFLLLLLLLILLFLLDQTTEKAGEE